jgi:serine O-acetyltransferase
MTLGETRRRLAADLLRLQECFRERGVAVRSPRLTPSYVCVALYRYSRLCYMRGWRRAARLVWQVNVFLTGADLSPLSDVGEGLLIVHPHAVTLIGSAGRNLSIEGQGGLGGGMAMDDVGAGPGVPLLGDDVRMERGAMVLGPVRIGDGVRIGAGCTVVHDIAGGSEVAPHRVRVLRAANARAGEASDDAR